MTFATVSRGGDPRYFFLRAEKPKEWAIIKPYYLIAASERIVKMDYLFSGDVLGGRMSHGCACSADVYGMLIDLIKKLHGNRLSTAAAKELDALNIHKDHLTLSDTTLQELETLNAAEFARRYGTLRRE